MTRLDSGRWRVRVTAPDGHRSTLGMYATEQEAWTAVDRFAGDTSRGQWTPSRAQQTPVLTVWDEYVISSPTTSGAVERSRAYFRNGFLTCTSAAAQARDNQNRRVRTPLGEYAVGDLTVAICRRWVRAMQTEGLAPVTIETQWGHLRRALEHAVAERLIPTNPAAGSVPLPRGAVAASTKDPYFLTLPEIVALTQATSPRHALMIETLLWSGLRQSECRALDGPAVLATAGLIRIDHTITAGTDRRPRRVQSTKTAASERRVPIPAPIITALAARDLGPGVPLFPAARGGWFDERRFGEAWDSARE